MVLEAVAVVTRSSVQEKHWRLFRLRLASDFVPELDSVFDHLVLTDRERLLRQNVGWP